MSTLELVAIRHSITEKNGTDHRQWKLSQDGITLANERGLLLGPPYFDLALCSPISRTRHTAAIICLWTCDHSKIVTVPEFFPDQGTQLCEELDRVFGRLSHAPLADYYDQPEAQTIRDIGRGSAHRIVDSLWAWHNAGHKRVLSVGHGMLVPAMIDQLAEYYYLGSNGERDRVLSRKLTECEGYRITFQFGGSNIAISGFREVGIN